MSITPEAIAEKVTKGIPLSPSEWEFSKRRLETMLKRAAVIKRPEFEAIVKKKYREVKTATGEPKVETRRRFERGMLVCLLRPYTLRYYDKYTGKKIGETTGVERRCRDLPETEVACYESAVASKKLVEGEEPEPCQKVEVALACANDLSPTLASAITELPKEECRRCLDIARERKEAYAKPVTPPPSLPEKEIRKDWFLDEPIYRMAPEKRRETLRKVETLTEKVPV